MQGKQGVPKIVSVFEHLPSEILNRFSAEGLIELVSPPPGLSFSDRQQWLLEALDGAHAAIVSPVAGSFGAEQIAATNPSQGCEHGRFKIVSTFSVGTEAIDAVACQHAGIKIGYTPYVSDNAVAEYTIAMLLHYCRRLVHLEQLVLNDRFPHTALDVLQDPTLNCGFSPAGKTICFYGFGRIAQKAAEKLLAFGVSRIIYTTSRPKPFNTANFPRLYPLRQSFYPETSISNELDLAELAAQADILILLCPANPSTHASINADVLSRMKKSAVLINVARGNVVVNDDLLAALRSHTLSAALLDVVHGEPHVGPDHPLLAEDLRDRVMILPHSASTETETRKLMCEITARNILTLLGFPDHLLGDKPSLIKQHAWTHYAER